MVYNYSNNLLLSLFVVRILIFTTGMILYQHDMSRHFISLSQAAVQ